MTRRGITTTELVCAAIVSAVVGLTLVPVLTWIGRQHETAQERLEATTAVSNVLDEIAHRPYADVTPESLSDIALPDWIQSQLLDAALECTASPGHSGKRVVARLSWKPSHGGTREHVTLVYWMFPAGGGAS